MSTLGQKPATQHVSTEKQTITGNGGTSYTLQQSVSQASDIEVFVNNTRQEPTVAYTASGTTLTMTGAVNSSDSFYVIFQGKAIQTAGLPVDAAITASTITTSQTITSTGNITTSGTVNTPSINGGQIGGRRNVVINGGFQCWQRATSITASGFSADRWRSTTGSGGAMTVSRQEFTIGQTDVPNNPKYFFRHAQTTAFTNTGYNSDRTRIEDVRTLSGQTCTLSWYMKADASRTVRVNITQDFGQELGGGPTPSSDVETAIVSSQAITTSWAEYSVTFTMPSISGKTIGTNGDDFIELGFDYRAEVNNTFTIDIANVQLEAGAQATPFEVRTFGEELPLCKRYFERITGQYGTDGTSGFVLGGGVWYSTTQVLANFQYDTKRASPTISISSAGTMKAYGPGYARSANDSTCFDQIAENNARINISPFVGTGTAGYGTLVQMVSNETIDLDAEL